jgi:ATP-dependent DNA helicase RecG
MLDLSNHRKNYQKYVEPLINEGLLVRTIPDKPTSKLQRYSTTQKGKNIINNIADYI